MAKLVLTNANVKVNSVDISNHVSAVAITSTRDTIDVTSMGDSYKEYVLGLADATITVTVFNDYSATSIDSQMSALQQTNTPFPVVILPNGTAVGTNNPTYTMASALMPTYNPIDGNVGAAVTTDLVFINSSQAGIVRATS